MTINFEVTSADFTAFSEHFYKKSASGRRLVIRVGLVGFLALTFLPALVIATSDKPLGETLQAIRPLLMGPVMFAPMFLIFLFVLSPWLVRQQITAMVKHGEARGALGPASLTLRSDGIHSVSATGESRINWSSVRSIELVDSRLFIFLDNPSGWVIPRKAFKDERELRSFIAEVERHSGVAAK